MKPITISAKRWATHCRVRGDGYAAAMAPALLETRGDGSRVFDADHPAWADAVARHQRNGRDSEPSHSCATCGDKTNAAQVKASPAAMDDLLRG
jgi:hypothetical protein